MRVTVCELNDQPDSFARDWAQLVRHVKDQGSDLVLLPEMPFCPWFCTQPVFEQNAWQAAVDAHVSGRTKLAELWPAIVLGTQPVNLNERRLNEAFCQSAAQGFRVAHHKYYLPDEEGFWEASWYDRGDGSFTPTQCGVALVGFQICTELWSMENARLYGKNGVDIIATPRATPKESLDKWLVAGRAAAIVSGAFSLSSNHVSEETSRPEMGGQGWIIGPEGKMLGLTSRKQPFVTVDIDLQEAAAAKHTYPRYAL
jgi:N-carbamoylputrescine amidase